MPKILTLLILASIITACTAPQTTPAAPTNAALPTHTPDSSPHCNGCSTRNRHTAPQQHLNLDSGAIADANGDCTAVSDCGWQSVCMG